MKQIEIFLRYMQKKKDYNEFTQPVADLEQPTISCSVTSVARPRRKEKTMKQELMELRSKYDTIVQEYEDLKCDYDDMNEEFNVYRDKNNSLDYNFEIVLSALKSAKLDRKHHKALTKFVVDDAKVNDKGRLLCVVPGHEIYAIICSVFDENMIDLPCYYRKAHHATNVNEFLSDKGNDDDELMKRFIEHFVSTRKWKNIIMDCLKLCDRLDVKQTMIQYIQSKSSLRNFCKNNAQRNKVFGHKTTQSEGIIRKAIMEVQLDAELYR